MAKAGRPHEHRKNFRLTDEDMAYIARLSAAWGPVKPLNDTDVVREALRRAVEAIPGPRRKSGKKSESGC